MPVISRANEAALTAEELRRVLAYDPDTGIFTWKVSLSNRVHVGKKAGNININGYLEVCIGGNRFKGHRLAHLYMTGAWPTGLIDHIDGNTRNNRWCNLRNATHSQNRVNAKMYKTNKTGFKGVVWDRSKKKFVARISANGIRKPLGNFTSPEAASAAYERAARALHGEFHRDARKPKPAPKLQLSLFDQGP